MRFFALFTLVLVYLISCIPFAGVADDTPLTLIKNYQRFFSNACSKILESAPLPKQISGWHLGYQKKSEIHFYDPIKHQEVKIRIVNRARSQKNFRFTFNKNSQPELFLATDGNCKINIARLIKRDQNDKIHSISTLSEDLYTQKSIEFLNPKVPFLKPKSGVKVALVDTGVNYLLPEISKNLARESPTELLGYDFEDRDKLPFDVDFVGSPFFPRRHGTSVASILIEEAPFVQIVPYRFSRKDPCSFKEIIAEIGKLDIKVALVPMGSRNFNTWKCFHDAVRKHKDVLFVVSAGNSNINIDTEPIYPASLNLENILVISSSTIFGDLAKGSNFGPKTVDLLVNAEQLRVIDHRGVKSIASGSSFAVPRVGAMIARFLTYNPGSTVEEILEILKKRAVPLQSNFVKLGWIPDPLDDYLF